MPFPFLVVALIIGGLGIAMALLAPKPHIENAKAGKLSDFSFPRSNKGDPVPLLKGTTRLRYPNTIGLGGFRTVAIKQKVSTGLFSSKKQTIGYKYFVTLALGLGLGPNARIKRIWYGKKVLWTGDTSTGDTITINLPEFLGGKEKNGGLAGTIRVYGGDFDQPQNARLASVCDPNFPTFPGLSYIVFEDFWFGNSTSIEPIHVEVQTFSDVLGLAGGKNVMPNGLDENPIETAADIIATKFGRLGFATSIDVANFTEAALTIWDEDNGASWEIARPNRGVDLLKEILQQTDATMYQDPETGLIKIKLIRNDYDIEDLPILDESNVKAISNMSKTLWEQTINQVRVLFRDRSDDYADDAAQDQDFANIGMQNKVRSDERSMPGIYRADLAQEIAARERAKVSVPLFGFQIVVNREQVILRPGDPFILSWGLYGILQIVMRVRTFDLGAYDKGDITIVAAQDDFAAADVIYAPPGGSAYVPPVTDPSEITDVLAIEAPLWFARRLNISEDGTEAFAWALPRQPADHSLSFDMEVSDDAFATSATGIEAAAYSGAARLNGAYAAATGQDDGYDSSVGGIVVDGLDGAYTPVSGGAIQADGEGLILIGDEIMGYETVADLGGGSYRLTGIRRALLDTECAAHADNAIVVFLTGVEGLYQEAYADTSSITFRLLDHTSAGTFDIDDASDITINFDQRAERPAPPDYVTAGGVRTGNAARNVAMAIAWRERNRLDDTIRYEDDATQAPEAGQDYELKWRINAGAWTTVNPAGAATTIDTSGASAADVLHIELRSRRDGLLSRVASKCDITLT